MLKKKILCAVVSAAVAISSAQTGAWTQPVTSYAKDRVTFRTGAAYDQHLGIKTVKITSVKIPEGCDSVIFSPDAASTDDSLTSKDTKIAKVHALHQGMGWVISGQKTGKTTLRYKKGSDTGKLDVEVLPSLKLTALKKSVKVSGGKLRLTVKYKNNTDSDIVIQGLDISQAQILFEGDKTPSKDAVITPRWLAANVTIPAGKTKRVSVTESVSKTRKIKSFQYPCVYLKYHDVCYSAHVENRPYVAGADYHGTQSFSQYIK